MTLIIIALLVIAVAAGVASYVYRQNRTSRDPLYRALRKQRRKP